MARGRLISKSLGSSRKFHQLLESSGKSGEFFQLLFPLIIANTDDYGRLPGDAFTVKHVVLPSSPRSEADFEAALQAMHRVGLILRYVSGANSYIQVVDFDAHQPGLHKRTDAKFPPPPESPGISGNIPEVPGNSLLTQNPEGNPEGEPRTQKGREPGTALARVDDGLFAEFWNAYPRKKAKDDALKAWLKRKPTRQMLDVMLSAISEQRQSRDWLKDGGKFIPYPASWLNSGRWTDEVDDQSDLSDTARHNIEAIAGMERLLRAAEGTRGN